MTKVKEEKDTDFAYSPRRRHYLIGLSLRKDSYSIDVEAKGALDYVKLRHTISDQKYSVFPLNIQDLLYLPGQNY